MNGPQRRRVQVGLWALATVMFLFLEYLRHWRDVWLYVLFGIHVLMGILHWTNPEILYGKREHQSKSEDE